jgi:hypothetical protein
MLKGKRAVYNGVINIPEGERGEYAVKHRVHPPGHVFRVVTARTAIMGGHRGKPVVYDAPTTWHELTQGKDSRWMTDYPIEQMQIDQETVGIKSGAVLVGGLGLGYVATVLAKRPRITMVEVVELSQDVIDLVAPYVCADDQEAKAKIHFANADLHEHIPTLRPGSFDHAYYDIWASDGEGTFFYTVVPLLLASAKKVRGEPICWNDTVMRGQLWHGLTSRWEFAVNRAKWPDTDIPTLEELSEPRGSIWTDWPVAFFRWAAQEKRERGEVEHRARIYASGYGHRSFSSYWYELTRERVIYYDRPTPTSDTIERVGGS